MQSQTIFLLKAMLSFQSANNQLNLWCREFLFLFKNQLIKIRTAVQKAPSLTQNFLPCVKLPLFFFGCFLPVLPSQRGRKYLSWKLPKTRLPHFLYPISLMQCALCNITSKSQELNFEISEISEFCVRTAAVNYAWVNKIDGKDSLRLGLIRIRVN